MTSTFTISNSTVLPWNQYYLCNGSSLDASSQLSIVKRGNGGLFGQKLYQLSSVNVLIPTSSQLASGTQTITTTTVSLTMGDQTATAQNMLITSAIYYYGSSFVNSIAYPFKQFYTQFGLNGGTVAPSTQGTAALPNYLYFAVQVIDPSTCSAPTLVPVSPVTGYNWYNESGAQVSGIQGTAGVTFLTVSAGSTANMTIVNDTSSGIYPTATVYNFPYSINVSNTGNTDNNPYNWMLLTIPYFLTGTATSTTLSSMAVDLISLTPTLTSL
jgi:hypothetical protein